MYQYIHALGDSLYFKYASCLFLKKDKYVTYFKEYFDCKEQNKTKTTGNKPTQV